MTDTVLISSTEESTGKTGIAIALAMLAADRGRDAGYMKPKGTRLQSHVGKTLDTDPILARTLLDLDAEMHELEPVVYSPTFIDQAIRGKQDPDELREEVQECYEALAENHDLMVLEGGGELTAGGIINLTDADIAALLDADVLLVSRFRTAGDVDDVLAAATQLGENLAGVLFNAVDSAAFDEVETAVVPFLESRNVPVIGVVPRMRELAGVSVSELAGELNAELLTDASGDAFVERFIVGAMSGDRALRYFRRTKDAAVITGGDRSDIHTGAIEAPGVKCLILTGGFRPPSAIIGKAEEAGLPVLLVQSDTIATVEEAETIVRSGRVRDERTVERMRELLYKHADFQQLIGADSSEG